MINDINKNINTELINMIQATSHHVLESNLIDNTTKFYNRNLKNTKYIENNPKLLCQLIELVFEQFKLTARYYRLFINCASKESQIKYHSSSIWFYIQNVLIQLLEEYLDVKQANLNTDIDRITDMNAFFTRKSLFPFSTNTTTTVSNTDSSVNKKVFTFKGTICFMLLYLALVLESYIERDKLLPNKRYFKCTKLPNSSFSFFQD